MGSNSSGEWIIDAQLHASSSLFNLSAPVVHQVFCYGVDAVITLDQVAKTLLIKTPKATILINADGTINIETQENIVSSSTDGVTLLPGAPDANG